MLNTTDKKVLMFISGERCGKDTITHMITNELKSDNFTVTSLAFAEELKKIVSNICDISLEGLEDLKVHNGYINVSSEYTSRSRTAREFIIDISKYIRDTLGIDVLLNTTIRRILQTTEDIVIISDLRFKLEEDIIRSTFPNTIIVRIKSNLDSCDETTNPYELENIKEDIIFNNNKTEDNRPNYKEVIQLKEEILEKWNLT